MPELLAHGVLFSLVNEISQAKFGGLDAQLSGDDVGVGFQREERLDGAGAAKVAAGNGVGVNLQVLDGGVLNAVEPARVMPGGQRGVGLKRAIGAAGMDH